MEEFKLRDEILNINSFSDALYVLFYTDIGNTIFRSAFGITLIIWLPILYLKFLAWHSKQRGE
ncbi:hypothetical protein P9597_11090 [Aneurinibacillus migulanus]|uniref:hypothetical protein n=1 Tax=Aneurinibacillus migulanus TaxID=47500 RepID=UPI002E1F6D0F|nr:hypothetical protein [Aneurinibacillus migulanus]